MLRQVTRPWMLSGFLLLNFLHPPAPLRAFPATQDAQKDVAALEPGAPLERELKGGEAHSFRVRVTSGQFLHVVVEQKGVDVAVTLLGPDGNQIAAVDGPNAEHGPEPVVMAADVSGDYRLEVRAPDEKAGAGRYEIRIVELRASTPADREHLAAERAFEEAYLKLRPQRSPAARHAAIEKYGEALAFFRSSGDHYRRALVANMIGLTFAESGEFRKALPYYDESLTLFRNAADRHREAEVLNNLGGAYDILGEPQKALNHYGQSLLLSRDIKDRYTEAIALNNLGKLHRDLADWQTAADYYDQALPIFRLLGDQRQEAQTFGNIGPLYNSLGESERALDYLQQSLPLWRAAGDKRGEAAALNNTGIAYAALGETRKALSYYEQALPLRRAAGDRLGEASTLDRIGVSHSALGEPEKALGFHQQALELRRAVEDRRGEAISLTNLGHVLTLLGRPDEATGHLDRALEIFRSLGDPHNVARALEGSARAERRRGDLAKARRLIEESLAEAERVRARLDPGESRASYLASRRDAYEFHIDLLMQAHRADPTAGHDAAALEASERARARGLVELLNEAGVDIRQGADARLLARERELTQQLRVKAQRLFARNTPEQLAALKAEVSELESEHRRVRGELRRNSPRYAALAQPAPLTLAEIRRQVLDADTLLLEYSLGEERSYVWAVTKDSLVSRELPPRAEIEKSAREVYELLTARGRPRPGETAPQRRALAARADAELPRAAAELSRLALSPVASELKAKRLVVVADGALQYIPFAMLPAPESQESGVWSLESKGEVRGGRKLSSSGPGPGTSDSRLQTPDPRPPLIARHEIVTLPSASVLAVQRRELAGRKTAPRSLAVIADPVFATADRRLAAARIKAPARGPKGVEAGPNSFEEVASTRLLLHLSEGGAGERAVARLPYTRREAASILAVAPAGANLKALDFDASRATATGAGLSQYRYVHFATHGYLDSERPGLSALVLSLVDEQGRPQDGFLRADEIYNLDLPAELVVLSACQTGLGKEVRGEGLVGLTRGFMYAGAARVAVSLWNVNDRATAELMAKFYAAMLRDKERPAAALRKAQVEMWRQREWQSPYYWAAFTIQGEWR